MDLVFFPSSTTIFQNIFFFSTVSYLKDCQHQIYLLCQGHFCPQLAQFVIKEGELTCKKVTIFYSEMLEEKN